ncbi:MAG: Ig-like domain-containing protein [Acidobacteria bacterium]|nr:Ig-like domain-containing protein [Acidobacteriota bacterium]
MSRKLWSSIPLLLAMALSPAAFSRNVFVLPPGDGVLRPVNPYTGDPFAPGPGGISAAQDSFLVLATPQGNKYYIIGRSATDTIVATSDQSTFSVVNRKSLGAGATAAVMSPDGSKIYVLAGSVYAIRTSDDQIITQFSGVSNPVDIAVSRDGTRLYVVGSNGTLTAVDTNTFGVLNSVPNLGLPTGVSVGPNGLVYVSGTNALYELDPVNLTHIKGTYIQLNGQPGKPHFVPDTFGNVRVVMTNASASVGLGSLLTVDLGTRTFTALQAGNVVLDKIVPVSGSRVFATSAGGALYDISIPSSFQQASFSGVGLLTNVRSIAASNEFPTARYLYAAVSGTNQLLRIDLSTNTVTGTLSTGTNPPGNVNFAGPATTGNPISIYLYNNGQFVNPGTQSLPLVVRAVDSNGRPLSGVPVVFATNSFGAIITTNATQFTDPDGYAQAIVIAPSTTGAFQVTVSAGSAPVVTGTFNLTSGTGSSGATGAISARSGNGQVIREAATTPELLRVVVRDTSGNPVPNAIVNWTATTINGPTGSLSFTQTQTDFQGESTNSYTSPIVGSGLLASYLQTTINASTFSGSVNFYVTVIPIQFGQTLASLPNVTLIQPASLDQVVSYQAGTTITGAIQVRVTAGSGPGAGSPIPNVGISATTGLDPTVAPTARCADNSGLTDSTGFASCDLVIGSKIGETQVIITAGGQQAGTLNILVTPGLPGKIIPTQGDNQAGAPGAQLPLALVATVQDGFGNNLPNVNVTWTVESGSATLINPITRSDTNSRVSALVRLGNSPGPVRVRVTAQGGLTTATAVFSLTVNLTATTMQRISGDGQTALINTAFPSPLVAAVLDANGAGVPGLQVNFSVNSGSVVLSTNSATSDSTGRVSVNVTAGSVAGPVTISATFGSNSVSWTLTVQPPGPNFTEGDITSVAGGAPGIAPGAIVKISGRNIVPSVSGTVFPAILTGPLPTTLGGATVTFGGVAAPIFYVTNTPSAGESIVVQVPYEAPENQSLPVTISSGGTSSTVNVTVQRVIPGIFETTDSQGRRYAVVVRNDGTFVTPDNAIARGEQARVYMSGLGRTTGAASTNTPGAGQRVNGTVVIGINDAGVRVISATLAPNLIGVYEVLFEVPSDAATGSARNFGAFVEPGGGGATAYANGSSIAIR